MSDQPFDQFLNPLELIQTPSFTVMDPSHPQTMLQQQLELYRPQYSPRRTTPPTLAKLVTDVDFTVILESGEVVPWQNAEVGVPEGDVRADELRLYGFRRDVLAVLDHSVGIVALRIPGATSLECFAMTPQRRTRQAVAEEAQATA